MCISISLSIYWSLIKIKLVALLTSWASQLTRNSAWYLSQVTQPGISHRCYCWLLPLTSRLLQPALIIRSIIGENINFTEETYIQLQQDNKAPCGSAVPPLCSGHTVTVHVVIDNVVPNTVNEPSLINECERSVSERSSRLWPPGYQMSRSFQEKLQWKHTIHWL